jgi:DNA-binding response OmpR family regulator
MDQSAKADHAEPLNTPAKKILLVEDDNYLADVYKTRLLTEGLDVLWVDDGEKALAAAMKYKPDLVLLDIMMHKVSGFEVLTALRKAPETSHVKIIMVTALGQDNNRDKAQQMGADDYLVKSQVVIADVVEKIKQHLGI